MLFSQRRINVDEHTLIQLLFLTKYQRWNNILHRHWIDVILSMLFQRCFVNVETTSINVRRLNFHFQPNINVETTLMNVDNHRCFKVDSTMMCLLGSILLFAHCPPIVRKKTSDTLKLISRKGNYKHICMWNTKLQKYTHSY